MTAWRGWLGVVSAMALGACLVPPMDAAGGFGMAGPGELDASEPIEIICMCVVIVMSCDGLVCITVPALGVDRPATMVLARLRDDIVPARNARIGAGYVLRLNGGSLVAPARVEWSLPPGVVIPSSELRIATTTGEAIGGESAVVPLPGAQAAADVVAAEVDGPATLLLVDRRQLPAGFAADLPSTSAGDALLARADVEGARAAYHTARLRGPDARAALGRALTDLMLMTSLPPVGDVFLRCGLSQDALLDALVGPGGVLAQAAEDRAGEVDLALTDDAGTSALQADESYARRSEGRVRVTSRGPSFELAIQLPGSEVALGVALSSQQFGGKITLNSRGDVFEWTRGAAGSVTLFQRGTGPGAPVDVLLEGLELTGAPGDVTLSGRMKDVVGAAPWVLNSLGASEEEGPPLVPVLSKVLFGCSPDVTMAWLASVSGQLSQVLASVAGDLAEAAGATQSTPLLWLPTGLTRLPRNTPLTGRDARVLSGTVSLLRAGLATVAAYRLAGADVEGVFHPVSDYVVDGVLHRRESNEIVERVARILDHGALAREINEQLLVPMDAETPLPAQLQGARALVEQALGDLRAAAASSTISDGLVRWSVLQEKPVLLQLQVLAEAMLASLPEGTAAVTLVPDSPFAIQLSKFFDTPPTHERLLSANGGEPFTRVFDGAPQGRTAESRDRTLLPHDRGMTGALWESFMELPPLPVRATCSGPADTACGEGNKCSPDEAGVCSISGSACVDDEGCASGDSCTLEHRCRRSLPPGLAWEELSDLFGGPQAPALAPGLWHIVQPLLGRDPARSSARTR